MGTKYCKPVRQTPELLEVLHGFPMVEVRTKYNVMMKLHNKKGYYFFTSHELKDLFNLTDEQMYFVVSTFTANQDVIRVGSIDFWCALALAASGNSNDKISFGFKLVDTNNDDFVSYNELIVLFICATRGVARLKGLTFVPENLIDRIVMRAFQVYQKDLNEHGEIALKDLIEYLLTNENCRAYLAGLGAKLPPVDSAAMVLKRAHILRELAQLRFQMDDIVTDLEDAKDNYDVSKERGGDVELLRIGDGVLKAVPGPSGPSPQEVTAPANFSKQQDNQRDSQKFGNKEESSIISKQPVNSQFQSSVSSPALLNTIPEDDQFEAIKESLGKDHPVNKYFGYDDSWLGEIYNKPRPYLDKTAKQREKLLGNTKTSESHEEHISIYGKSFEDMLLKEWRKLPQEADMMVELDEYTLMALFQQLNVNITFYFARKCLQSLPKSQLKRYNFYDVLNWFRKNYIENELDRDSKKNHTSYTNSWFEYVRQCKDGFESLNRAYSDLNHFILRQRKIITGKVV
jgi:Ca2+-binding EF-hand superfamily protein